MTTKEKLKKMLTDNGMFDNQADAVLKEAIPKISALQPKDRITWDRPSNEYPDVMFSLWWKILRKLALDWIVKNTPEAWFRPMFE